MKEYLIKWQDRDGGPAEEEDVTESAVAERLQRLASEPALRLYVRVPIEVKTSIRIVKRMRKGAPAVQPDKTVPPVHSAVLPACSTSEEQLYKEDIRDECLMEGCARPGETGGMCTDHYVGGISDKAKALLRSKKNARQSSLPETGGHK